MGGWCRGKRNSPAQISCPLNPLSPCSIYCKADLCGPNSVKSFGGLPFWLSDGFGQGEAPAGDPGKVDIEVRYVIPLTVFL